MSQIEFVFKFMKDVFYALILEGVLAIIVGVLVIIFPALLGILVGLLLIVGGFGALVAAARVKKFTKFKIEI